MNRPLRRSVSRCVRWERRPLIFWNGFGMEKRFPVIHICRRRLCFASPVAVVQTEAMRVVSMPQSSVQSLIRYYIWRQLHQPWLRCLPMQRIWKSLHSVFRSMYFGRPVLRVLLCAWRTIGSSSFRYRRCPMARACV